MMWDDDNQIHANDAEESRDARRYADEYVSVVQCNHVGGIHRGASVCAWCQEGPE